MSRTYVLMALHDLQRHTWDNQEAFNVRCFGPTILQQVDLYQGYVATFNHCIENGSFRDQVKHNRFLHMAKEVAIATDLVTDSFVSSALLICIQPQCHIEYVMTHPSQKGKGGATAAVVGALVAAQRAGNILCARLTCSPKLESFYEKIGFKREHVYEVQ